MAMIKPWAKQRDPCCLKFGCVLFWLWRHGWVHCSYGKVHDAGPLLAFASHLENVNRTCHCKACSTSWHSLKIYGLTLSNLFSCFSFPVWQRGHHQDHQEDDTVANVDHSNLWGALLNYHLNCSLFCAERQGFSPSPSCWSSSPPSPSSPSWARCEYGWLPSLPVSRRRRVTSTHFLSVPEPALESSLENIPHV